MWFKNTLNNTLNRPTKLLRLDSTGETTKDRADYTQEVRVMDPSKISRNPGGNSSYNFSILEQFKSLGIISGSGSALMNSFNKFTCRDPELPMPDIDNIKMAGENMSGHYRPKINAWGSWPNNTRISGSTKQNGFIKTGQFRKGGFRNQKSFKVPQNSPWLRVNSGYSHFQPSYSGSYDFNFRNSGNKNGFCDINNSSNHKINSKHKNKRTLSPNYSYRDTCVDPNPPKHHISDKSQTTKLPVSAEHRTTISKSCNDSNGEVTTDRNPLVCEGVSASHVIKRKCEDEHQTEFNPLAWDNKVEKTIEGLKLENKDLCVVSQQEGVKEEELKGIERERSEKLSPCAPINRLDSCVEDLFKDVETEHLEPKNDVNLENFQSQFNPNPQSVKPCDPSNVSKSAINSTNQPLQSSRTFHLTIIGGKCQAKEKTPPPNSYSSQSNQHNKTSKCQSNQTLSSVESDKSAQENQDKNCSICTAYLNRVTPECKDFPKSAGCKHSIILLVRDQSKKTKKRKEKRPKKAQIQSPKSPKSYIVGVNSLDTTDNSGSHVFQIIPQNVSDSEESWDSFDEEEDEVDGASCDWSKIDMDDLFPTNNCLFNPMNFKVHISPVSCTESQIETSDSSPESSQTNKYLDSINLSWNIQVDEKPRCAKSKSLKKVRFAEDENLATVYHMVAWSYAYRTSRKGPWEQYARDRERFTRRILDLDEVLSQILTHDHRSKIFNSLYGDGEN